MLSHEDFVSAIEGGRDELVRTLAEHRILPTVVEESGGSGLAGMSTAPTFRLDVEGGVSDVTDRQTTANVAETLGLQSEDDCQAVREEIRSHPAWSDG